MAGDSIVWLVIILSILICDGIAVYLYRKKRFPELGFNRVEEQADLFTKDNQMAVEVGKELIPQMDGDLLFYFTYLPTGDDSASATEAVWTADPLWQNLDAVKNGKAISVSDAVWNTSGGILAAQKMLEEIQELLSP